MCKTRLKPRWITILTGVAICALVCVYSTSSSWAAMCMVGYNSSACSGNSGGPVPPTSNNVGPDGPNPPIETDCERLGYSARGAKPNSSLWPKIALKNGENNTDKWICDVCQQNGTAVRDKSGFARYNCYLKCQYEDEDKDKDEDKPTNKPTNTKGGDGPIVGWTGVYRDQFVRSQADCNKLFGTKTGVNGKLVPAKKFYWITRNVCGQCIEQPCDGAAIEKGCYDVCNNKYTLENGTQCCNKLDRLVSLNPDYGDPNYWYPRTSPLYHESGCYTTTTHATAYGDFNNLSDSHPDALCYHQVKMTCPDSCDEPKEDNDCTCGPKSCETLAEETGQTYSANTDNIVENTVIYHFDNGEVEKVNGICFQKTPVSGCTSTGCYTLSKLTCPNGAPDSDCNCGFGCPIVQNPYTGRSQVTIPKTLYENTSAYINGKEYDNGRLYCLKDGCTEDNKNDEEYWSTCYTYNQCSDLGDFLVYDGAGGCTCGGEKDAEGRIWKTEPKGYPDCDIDNGGPVAEKSFSPPEGNIYNHYGAPITEITCYKYNHVTCKDVLSKGPDASCECHCTGDYASDDKKGTHKDHSDWTANSTPPDCAIGDGFTEYGYWTNRGGTNDIEIVCYRWDTVECNSSDSNGVLVEDGCDCKCGNGWTDEDRDIDPNTETKASQTGSYTNTDGESVTLTCYKYESKSCGSGEVLTDEGCKSCSDYTDEQSSSDCGCGKKVVETVEHQLQGVTVLTCYKCGNDDPRTCEEAGYISENATTPYPSDKPENAGDLVCEFESVSTSECVAWENGSAIACKKAGTTQAELAASHLSSVCDYDTVDKLEAHQFIQGSTCPEGVRDEYCYLGCEPWVHCADVTCPKVSASDCPGELIKSIPCASKTLGFCADSNGDLCFATRNGELSNCHPQSYWEGPDYGHTF